MSERWWKDILRTKARKHIEICQRAHTSISFPYFLFFVAHLLTKLQHKTTQLKGIFASKTISTQKPFCYLLCTPLESGMVLVKSAEFKASRGHEYILGKEKEKTEITKVTTERQREKNGMVGKDWAHSVVLMEHCGSHLMQREKGNTGQGGNKKAAGWGLPRSHQQIVLDCL